MAQDGIVSGKGTLVSIIIPTYNESQNILKILKSIGEILPPKILTEAIVVDDDSSDGTGKIVENYLRNFLKIVYFCLLHSLQKLLGWISNKQEGSMFRILLPKRYFRG